LQYTTVWIIFPLNLQTITTTLDVVKWKGEVGGVREREGKGLEKVWTHQSSEQIDAPDNNNILLHKTFQSIQIQTNSQVEDNDCYKTEHRIGLINHAGSKYHRHTRSREWDLTELPAHIGYIMHSKRYVAF